MKPTASSKAFWARCSRPLSAWPIPTGSLPSFPQHTYLYSISVESWSSLKDKLLTPTTSCHWLCFRSAHWTVQNAKRCQSLLKVPRLHQNINGMPQRPCLSSELDKEALEKSTRWYDREVNILNAMSIASMTIVKHASGAESQSESRVWFHLDPFGLAWCDHSILQHLVPGLLDSIYTLYCTSPLMWESHAPKKLFLLGPWVLRRANNGQAAPWLGANGHYAVPQLLHSRKVLCHSCPPLFVTPE